MKKTLAVAALVALLVTGLAPAASARPGTAPGSAGLDPGLQAILAALPPGGVTTVVVTLRDRADLKRVRGTSRAARLKGAIQELTATANASQVPIRTLLRARADQGTVTRSIPLWVVNGISVTATADVIRDLAERPDVASIIPDEVTVVPSVGLPEPGVDKVSAPALWNLGFSGQGVVVASLDSGVDVSHPDLAGRWRGGTDSWFDPYGEHPVTPTDLTGHGTATTGVILGGDAGGTSIGVAPGARWIAAKIFNDRGVATATAIHQAFQWVLDPDHDPNTPDAPQLVNGSWSIGAGPGCDLSFQPDLQALRAVGILPVFAAGNYGSGASTSVSPANYPEALAVGAVTGNDLIYTSGSRGPSTCGGRTRIFPDLVAPGVNILTDDRYGLYQTASGTSMAAPNATGALALLLSSVPGLTTDQAQAALTATALDLGPTGPDPSYGSGRLNVLAAYQWLLEHPIAADLTGPVTSSLVLAPSLSNGTTDAGLHATANDTTTGGSAIAAAEYFLDTLGANGTGAAMSVTPTPPTAGLDAAIPAALLAALADGNHTVFVHAKDAAGNWGAVATTILVIDKIKPVVPAALSFSTLGNTNPAGVAGTADDADIYSWSGTAFSRVVDASVAPYNLPGGANVDGFDRVSPTQFYLSFTDQVNVPGIGTVQDEDVVFFNGTTWSLYFTGSAHGLGGSNSLDVDAISVVGSTLYFSTLGNSNPPGVGGTADDADVYSWNGTVFSRVIDASAAPYGLPAAANVDGFVRVDATHFYLSFSADTTTVPVLGAVQDEDVVYYNAGTWSVYFDGTAHGLTAANQDLDAFDVP
ncbi:S8 family serine peptidase [Cryobacterium zhongshanensis]|uniref:S8 family serine peptidase n=1 Tax=Cryobacterium zhongshanensis TaxID=2928153 RepID=A0AA41UF01_9MICO|nr:S8 family serine peptidase [Cryobacterium zhongshanensis]MCI4657998.1 S8 family serine peptidase [Cryobacterium zhongshanensis]